MPLSRAQMPQISILASEDTQLYPCTQKSQKTPFKRVSAYTPLSPGISIRAYAHIHTRVYIIICPRMQLSTHLCICIYPCSYIATCTCPSTHIYPDTHIPRSGNVQGRGYVWLYAAMPVYGYTGVWTETGRQIYRGRHRHTAFHVYAPGTPLRGKRSGGGCQEQLNVCLIV